MEKKSLLHRLLYKYEYQGEVEKDGKIYKTYKKVYRYPIIKKKIIRAMPTIIIFLILLLVTYILIYLLNLPRLEKRLRSKPNIDAVLS